jgi:phage host-nuclease inhibitor protein Gam
MANFDIIVKAVDQTKGTFQSVETGLAKIERRAQLVNKAIASINTVANVAAVALGALTVKAVGYAGAINDASENTGIAVQSILALGNALTTNGGEASKAADAVNKFTDAVGTANSGSKELRESFAKVGISLQDLRTLDDTALFEKTLAGLAGIEDATKRNNIQADIFGKTLKGANIAGFGKDIGALSQAQRENAAAIKAAGQASDALKNSFNTIQVAAVKALKPIADAINNLGQEKINKIADAFLQIAVALTALAGAAKVLSVITSVAAAFGAAWLTATVGVAKLSLAFTSLGRTVTFATGYVTRFVAGVGGVTTVGGLLVKLLARIPYAISAVGLALAGLVRFIPFVGLIATALYAVNEAVKFAFDINPLDYFITKAKEAYEFIKRIVGFGKEVKTTAADFQRTDKDTTPVAVPTVAGANRDQKDITFLGQLRENYAKTREEYLQLVSALNKTTDLNFASKIFEELSSRAEQLGIAAIKPTSLILRDFNLELDKTAENLRRNEVEYSNVEGMVRKLELGLRQSSFALMEQEILLGNNTLAAEKFRQELQQTTQGLTERVLKLDDANYQEQLFRLNLREGSIAMLEQQKRLEQINQAFADGKIELGRYAELLAGVDEKLLGVTEKTALLNAEFNKTNNTAQINNEILAALTGQYESGAIGIDEYTKKLSLLSYEYENLTSVTAKAMKGAKDDIRTQDLSTEAVRNLTQQLKAGTITWRQYENTVKKLDSEGVAKSFINVTREIERAKSMAEVFAETLDKSVRSAGDTLADSLTDGIVKGKLSLNSFKDFFGSILNDIAAMIVKKQFVSPIVDALTGAMSGGGSGGNILSSIAAAAGKGSGFSLGGISDFFSGGFSGLSDWFGGFFQDGGYLPSGKVGIAGEAGPELITGPANIVPMDKMGGGNQPTPIVNFTINAIDTQTGVEFLMKNKPQIIGMVQQGFNSQGKRGIYR